MEQTTGKKFSVYEIVLIGVMSAVVFASNFLSIQFGDVTRLHFGNVTCVLSGLLFGALRGGLCAGIGSFFYDLCNPLFAAEAPITFLMKFVLGAVAGAVSHAGGKDGKSQGLNIAGAVAGSLSYIAVYLCKNFIQQYYLIKNPLETVWKLLATKATVSTVNAAIAVVAAVLLAPLFRVALERSGFMARLRKKAA